MSEKKRKRIVILGGGFCGVYTAKYLEKSLGRRDDFEIVLVNKENYFVFQPMLPEVISGNIGLLDIVSPIRRLLPRTNLHVRDVESIDVKNKTITGSTIDVLGCVRLLKLPQWIGNRIPVASSKKCPNAHSCLIPPMPYNCSVRIKSDVTQTHRNVPEFGTRST